MYKTVPSGVMEIYLLIGVTCLIAGTNGVDRDFPPIIKDPIVSQTIYEQAAAEVILSCKADANPPAEYEWKWNGYKISDNEHIEEDRNSGEIRIKSLSRREMGDFQCYAYNRIGGKIIKAASAIITVEVAYLNGWDTNDDPVPRIPVNEGEPVKLTCDDAPSRNPSGQFKWYRGDEEGGEVIQDTRIAIDAEGSLHFAYALKADDLAGQEYKCAIFSRELNSINLGSGKILDVTEFSPLPNRKPNVVYYQETQKALVGYDVDIECVFSGYPLATITWKDKDQQEIPSSGRDRYEFIDESHRILRINKVVETDEGLYTCSGTNQVGSDDRSTFLNVTSRPIWVKALLTQTIVEKRTAPMMCKTRPSIREGPNSPPEWYENGDPISQVKLNSGKYVLEDNGQILRVTNLVKPDDITCYQCKVTNSEGFTFGSGCLDVIEPIEITRHPEETQVIKKGDIIDLTFLAESEPAWTLQYKWYFNDEAYQDRPPFVTYNETANTAYINTESLTDEEYGQIFGVYTREIFHLHERKNISTTVQEISGVWSDWSQHNHCSVTCGQGIRIRTRQCNTDPLTNEDANCTGNAYENVTCNEPTCPEISGVWSDWSQYSNCSVTCGQGIRIRTRRCNIDPLTNEDANCTGNAYENMTCIEPTCPGMYVPWIVSGLAILVILVFAIIWFIRLIRTRIHTARCYDTPSRQPTDYSPNQEYTDLQLQVIDDDHVGSPYLALLNTTNEYASLNAETMDAVHYQVYSPEGAVTERDQN